MAEEHLRELVKLVGEEMDSDSAQWRDRLDAVEAELADVERRLERLYEALETGHLELDDVSPRIHQHRHRQEQLEAAHEEIQDRIQVESGSSWTWRPLLSTSPSFESFAPREALSKGEASSSRS